jgi:CRP-like cAMP-binding protein
MSLAPQRDSGNHILDLLPQADFDIVSPMLQLVELTYKQTVQKFEEDMAHAYFPTSGMISLMTVLQDEDPVEVATIGRNGLVGLPLALGVAASPHLAICQMAGEALRLPARSFRDAMRRAPGLERLVHLYIAWTLRSAGQGVACNALHPVEERACRWLLMLHNQAASDEFAMTQEFLAYMLGVRRQSVTVVAGALQNAGLIRYRRGVITVLDRARLEESACECYATLREYYTDVMT